MRQAAKELVEKEVEERGGVTAITILKFEADLAFRNGQKGQAGLEETSTASIFPSVIFLGMICGDRRAST